MGNNHPWVKYHLMRDGSVTTYSDGSYCVRSFDSKTNTLTLKTYTPENKPVFYSVTEINGVKGVSRLFSPTDELIEKLDGEIGILNYSERWRKDGKLHRRDAPAYISVSDSDVFHGVDEEWYLNGKRHRENGPAVVTRTDQVQVEKWYRNGERHREGNQPAVVYNYSNGDIIKEWYMNDEYCRYDGPAYESLRSGDKVEYWYRDGKRIKDPEEIVETKQFPVFQIEA